MVDYAYRAVYERDGEELTDYGRDVILAVRDRRLAGGWRWRARSRLRAALALPFQKWQALGNDYIIVERDRLPFELTPERVRRMCAAHFGCHSDGVLELSPPSDERFVARLRIFNPDGSEAELSGNGAREAVLYLRREGWTDAGRVLDRDRGGRGAADDHLRRARAASRWGARA